MNEAEALDAIYASPEDDALRAVYADMLQARGDPRGEFIALQLCAHRAGADAAEATQRASAVLDGHRETFLGPLADVVVASTCVFERGFLARCTVDVATFDDLPVYHLPAWSTVKSIHFRPNGGALGTTMRAVEELVGVPEGALVVLRERSFPRLARLHVVEQRRTVAEAATVGASRAGLVALTGSDGVPALRELGLGFWPLEEAFGALRPRGPADYAWVLESKTGQRLDRFLVNVDIAEGPEALADWARWLSGQTHPPRAAIVLRTELGDLELTRSGVQVVARAVIEEPPAGSWGDTKVEPFEEALAAVDVEWQR